jgi:hypothetical protein
VHDVPELAITRGNHHRVENTISYITTLRHLPFSKTNASTLSLATPTQLKDQQSPHSTSKMTDNTKIAVLDVRSLFRAPHYPAFATPLKMTTLTEL